MGTAVLFAVGLVLFGCGVYLEEGPSDPFDATGSFFAFVGMICIMASLFLFAGLVK